MSVVLPTGQRNAQLKAGEPIFGISQRDLAKLLGISRNAVVCVEKRAKRKFREAIEREAAAAGVSPIEWLFGVEKEETNG